MIATSIFISLLLLITVTNSVPTSVYYRNTTQCIYSDVTDNYVTYCDLNNTLRAQLLAKFENFATFVDLIGKIVRLVFHDCFGPKETDQTIAICDGCLDYKHHDHAGLELGAIGKIDSIYTKSSNIGGHNWHQRMSRADFWAASATILLQESARLNGSKSWRMVPESMQYPNDQLPYIPFYTGRKDCSATPQTAISTTKEFPSAILGWSHNFALFRHSTSGFDLTAREYICLLGAHSLGRVIRGHSGFGTETGSPWAFDWDVVGNAFYSQLLDDGYRTQRKNEWVQKERLKGDGIYVWFGDPILERFRMLNSDMGLLLNYDTRMNTTTGKVTCDYNTCPRNAVRVAIIQEFASDNQLWLNEFAAVFNKMIRTGYDRSMNPSDLKVLAEDWYYTANNVDKPTFTTECNSIVEYTSDMDTVGQLSGIYGPIGRITDRRVSEALTSTIGAFVADINYILCDKNLGFMKYYYRYTYNANGNRMVFIDTRICCGKEAALFPSTYSLPPPESEWNFVGSGAAFSDFDDEIINGNDLVKQIIVFSVCGLIVCCGIIGAVMLYKRYKQNKHLREMAGVSAATTEDPFM